MDIKTPLVILHKVIVVIMVILVILNKVIMVISKLRAMMDMIASVAVLLLSIRMNFNFHRACLLMKDVFPTAASPAKTTLNKYRPLR